jgi:hypothetical protein
MSTNVETRMTRTDSVIHAVNNFGSWILSANTERCWFKADDCGCSGIPCFPSKIIAIGLFGLPWAILAIGAAISSWINNSSVPFFGTEHDYTIQTKEDGNKYITIHSYVAPAYQTFERERTQEEIAQSWEGVSYA